MADFRLICPICAAENVFSEYSEESARCCRSCGISFGPPMMAAFPPSQSAKPALRILDRASRKPPPFSVPENAGAHVSIPTAGRSGTVVNVRREGGRSRWMAVLSLLLFFLLFVGSQALLPRFPQWTSYYLRGRYAVAALGLILILRDAFREAVGQGAMCLLVPFYVVYYGLTRVESYWRQGLTLAILAMLAAELYFLPNQALLRELSVRFAGLVEGVGRLIRRAGDAPMP